MSLVKVLTIYATHYNKILKALLNQEAEAAFIRNQTEIK